MLYRKIQPFIESYLKSDSNKVLIIDGARQIGKTYIIRHVGQQLFENYIEVNFAEDQNGPGLFEKVRTVRDHVKKAYVLSNTREITTNGKITYLPVYDVMFLGGDR
ncbi:MAG: AAA family ATPase [Oscillospiraceae bacterium]|nr:AAA family ATPase [Oscillospiraceae bacterium]